VPLVKDVHEPVLPAGLTTAVGGPAGRRLVRPSAGPLAALAPAVLLLGVPLGLAALRQTGCLAAGWRDGTPLWRQCSSPLVESLPAADLGRGLTAYLSGSVRLDEPVLTGVATSFLAGLAPDVGLAQQRWFLTIWVVVAAVLLVGLVVAVGTTRRHPAADPVVLALSPVLALTVLLSADLIPVALATLAVWAWSRDRAVWAGGLAGLAILAGTPSAVVLLAMVLVRAPGGDERVLRLLGTAGATVVAVALPVALLDTETLTGPYAAWLASGAGAGSPWYLFTLAGRPVGATQVALIAGLGWLLAAGLVALLARRRPPPVVAAAAVVGLATVLMTAPAFPPSAALWLLPFLALLGLGWRDHLLWAGAEAVHAVALYGHLIARADPSHGLPAGWYAFALLLRLLAVAWLARQAWVAASWGDAVPAGTLWRLPSRGPVDNSAGAGGGSAYPPVTERP
jgi:hypothetical protein